MALLHTMAAMHQKVKDKDICYNTKHLSSVCVKYLRTNSNFNFIKEMPLHVVELMFLLPGPRNDRCCCSQILQSSSCESFKVCRASSEKKVTLVQSQGAQGGTTPLLDIFFP